MQYIVTMFSRYCNSTEAQKVTFASMNSALLRMVAINGLIAKTQVNVGLRE